jgi:hypothetical protein
MRFSLDLGAMAVEMAEVGAPDLLTARDLVTQGEIVLIRDEVAAPNPKLGSNQWLRDIAESIANCAVVPLSCLTGATLERYPLVAGPPESIRFLCSYADPLPPDPFPFQTRAVVTDYREFRNLWVADSNVEPKPFMFQIGQRMADLHSRNVLHGDAHLGNWGVVGDHVVIADPDPAFLHCPPTPEQCATDIRPLLPDLEPADWYSFRLGYRQTRPDEGRVIDLIQLGDRTGWAAAFRASHHDLAAELLDRELTHTDDPHVVRVMLLSNRALSLSRMGRHDDALRDYLAAAVTAREHCPHVAQGLAFVGAIALDGAGCRAEAIDMLGAITSQPSEFLARYAPPDTQLPIMNM